MRNKNIYIMFFIVFLQGLVFYGPVATLYREFRGISLSEIFIIESISWILTMLLEVPWGWFADKFGYKKTLVISNFIFFISKIIFFKSYTFIMFLLERVFLSISIAGLSGCDTAFLYTSLDKNRNSEKIFGLYNSFSTIGFLVACISSYSIINISMDFAVFLTIITYGIAAIATLFISDTSKPNSKNNNIVCNFKVAIKNKQIIYIVISFSLISLVVQSITVFLNQAQYIKSGIDIKYFGILLALNQIIKLSASKSYKLSKKYGKLKSIKIMYLAIGLSCIMLAFTSNIILSILSTLLISLCISLVSPMVVDIENKSITTEDRATILSIYSMISSVISAMISPVIGVCADISIDLAFFICCIICIMAYVILKKQVFEIVKIKDSF